MVKGLGVASAAIVVYGRNGLGAKCSVLAITSHVVIIRVKPFTVGAFGAVWPVEVGHHVLAGGSGVHG